ncbi:VOC family protein [Empedobacter tilapiae]|uniref:VOC family protein n=1 Tax=Empedobacter tilapiae TaxID=2491114 RepID=A0A4Z1AWH4_9FLAO|nr:VOC family protein [Empedobacter tilapiae]TGN21928.1 VOC family protein [Empedobacter tilapiae]
MVKLGYTILYVSDVEKSIKFYEKAFGFNRKFITPENDYGELSTGETTISFVSKDLANSNLKNGFIESSQLEKPFGIELALITDDVQKVIDRAIELGALIAEEAIQKPWGQTVSYIRDIDGFLLEICTPIK